MWQLPPGTVTHLGLFDILGFKAINRQQSAAVLGEALPAIEEELRTRIVNWGGPSLPRVSHLMFSDSILLYTGTTTAEGLTALTMVGSGLIANFGMSGFPMRGALTKGELAVTADGRMFFGKGLVKAYALEQEQDWVGAVLDDEALTSEDDLDGKALAVWLGHSRRAVVPFDGGQKECDVVDWCESVPDPTTFAADLRRLDPSPNPRGLAKQEAGVDFLAWSLCTDVPFRQWDDARQRVAKRWGTAPAEPISQRAYHAQKSRTGRFRRREYDARRRAAAQPR
jgi:hypothetical protein